MEQLSAQTGQKKAPASGGGFECLNVIDSP